MGGNSDFKRVALLPFILSWYWLSRKATVFVVECMQHGIFFKIYIQFNGALCFKQCTRTKIDFTPNAVNSRVVDHPIIVGHHETSDSWNGTDVVTTNTIMYRL